MAWYLFRCHCCADGTSQLTTYLPAPTGRDNYNRIGLKLARTLVLRRTPLCTRQTDTEAVWEGIEANVAAGHDILLRAMTKLRGPCQRETSALRTYCISFSLLSLFIHLYIWVTLLFHHAPFLLFQESSEITAGKNTTVPYFAAQQRLIICFVLWLPMYDVHNELNPWISQNQTFLSSLRTVWVPKFILQNSQLTMFDYWPIGMDEIWV